MLHLFHEVLYRPLLNLLVFFYDIFPFHDLGLAILLLTLVIRLILWPLSQKALKSQKALQVIQPKITALREKYKKDPSMLARATMAIYKENKVNPFSSIFLLLIQLPILWAVYQVFMSGLVSKNLTTDLYSFISNPGVLNVFSFGVLDLSKPNLILTLITGLLQYWQGKMLSTIQPPPNLAKKEGAKDEGVMAIMNKQMIFMMPILTVFIGLGLPSGLMLYWLIGLVLTIIQQKLSFKKATSLDVIANKK